MFRNMVIIKHIQDNGKYLFRVPKGISLSAGDKVIVNTCRGNDQLGVCLCDSFMANPEVICPLFGTEPDKMRFITGKVEYEKFDEAMYQEEYEDDDE